MVSKYIENIVLKKLKLTKRGCLFILSNEELCDRIIIENPMYIYDFVNDYPISEGFIRKLIEQGVVSSFSNSFGKGSKLYIFKDEVVQYTSRTAYNPNFINSITHKTVDLYLKAVKNHLTDIEYDCICSILIKKESISEVAKRNDMKETSIIRIFKTTYENINYVININTHRDILEKKHLKLLLEHKYLSQEVRRIKKETPEVEKIVIPEKLYELNSVLISEIDIPIRVVNCLKYSDIKTIYDLLNINEIDLYKFRDLGKVTITAIKDFLERNDLELGMLKNNN